MSDEPLRRGRYGEASIQSQRVARTWARESNPALSRPTPPVPSAKASKLSFCAQNLRHPSRAAAIAAAHVPGSPLKVSISVLGRACIVWSAASIGPDSRNVSHALALLASELLVATGA